MHKNEIDGDVVVKKKIDGDVIFILLQKKKITNTAKAEQQKHLMHQHKKCTKPNRRDL